MNLLAYGPCFLSRNRAIAWSEELAMKRYFGQVALSPIAGKEPPFAYIIKQTVSNNTSDSGFLCFQARFDKRRNHPNDANSSY